jgi:hypothetical protein
MQSELSHRVRSKPAIWLGSVTIINLSEMRD